MGMRWRTGLNSFKRLAADSLRRRIGCRQVRKLALEVGQLAVKGIVFPICNNRAGYDVIPMIMRTDFFGQFGMPHFRLGVSHEGKYRVFTDVAPNFPASSRKGDCPSPIRCIGWERVPAWAGEGTLSLAVRSMRAPSHRFYAISTSVELAPAKGALPASQASQIM